MVRLEFLSITGQTVNTATLPLTLEGAIAAVEQRNWAHRPQIRAIRITSGHRSVLRRRPLDAFGPGSLPVLRAGDPEPKIPEPRKPSPGSRRRAMNGL